MTRMFGLLTRMTRLLELLTRRTRDLTRDLTRTMMTSRISRLRQTTTVPTEARLIQKGIRDRLSLRTNRIRGIGRVRMRLTFSSRTKMSIRRSVLCVELKCYPTSLPTKITCCLNNTSKATLGRTDFRRNGLPVCDIDAST